MLLAEAQQDAKRALSDLSTLSSEREGGKTKSKKPKHDNWGETGRNGVAGEPLSPALYDGAYDVELYGGAAAVADAKRRRRSSKPGAEQGALPIDG